MARLLPPDQAAIFVQVRPATLRDWRRRGLLRPSGGTERRPLYAMADLYAAKQAAKPRRQLQKAA